MVDDDDLELDVSSNSGSNMKMIIMIVIIGILLVIVSVGATMLLMGGSEVKDEVTDEIGAVEKEKIADQHAVYFDVRPPFVVNFHTKGRIRYLQIHVEVMARSDDVIEQVQAHLPLIKNNLVTLFGSQDFTSLQTYQGKEKLRESALEEVQRVMIEQTGEPGVEAVLFTSFVIQ